VKNGANRSRVGERNQDRLFGYLHLAWQAGTFLKERYRWLLGEEDPKPETCEPAQALSPLSRAYPWRDGSLYAAHNGIVAKCDCSTMNLYALSAGLLGIQSIASKSNCESSLAPAGTPHESHPHQVLPFRTLRWRR
jgi:hypothetical protein